MKNLILICAGGFGREIAAWAPNCIGYNKDWKIKGFIDSDVNNAFCIDSKKIDEDTEI